MKNQNSNNRQKYDGVVYEPSLEVRSRNGNRAATEHGNVYFGSRTHKKRPSKKYGRSNFTLFYVFLLFTGIMVCIVVFIIFFTNLNKNFGGGGSVAPTPLPAPVEVVIEETTQVLGVIDTIDIRTGSMKLMEVSNGSYHELYYDSSTVLTNKFGQSAVFSEFKAGDMVDAKFNSQTSRLKSLSASAQTWEFRQVKNVNVSPTQQTVTIGNDTYIFDDGLVVIYDNSAYPVHSVSTHDLVTVRGYRNKVHSILVHKSHGSIEIVNKDYVKNGVVEVDTNIYMMLESADYIELQEGTHRIVIKGSNIEPFIREIELGPKENIRINLEEADYKTGMLFVSANVNDYVVIINDKQVASDEAITLSYGVHTLRLEKTDYEIWQKDITINAPRVNQSAILTPIVKMGRLVVDTNPSGAQVYVDGKLMGTTPFEGTVEQGMREVMMRLAGYRDRTEAIDVTDSLPPYIFEMFPAAVNYDPNVIATPTPTVGNTP